MITSIGLRLAKAEENPLFSVDGVPGVFVPFLWRGADAVILRDEVFWLVPVGRWSGVPVCDPAYVGFIGVGERDVALVVGFPACGGDNAAFARAAAGAGC